MYLSFLEKDSYRKVFLFVLLIVTIIVSIISSKEEPVQDNTVIEIVKHVKPEKINHEREYEEVAYSNPVIKTKPIVQKDVMPDEQIIEEDIKTESQKPIVIFNTYDETINYNIQLTTNEIINNENDYVKYLPIFGKIKDDTNTTNFNVSLDQNYLNSSAILNIQVTHAKTQKKYLCDGSFLNNLNKNNSYSIKIDIFNDSAYCYISFEQYLPKRNIEKNSTLFLEENATYNKSKISEDTLFQSISPKF